VSFKASGISNAGVPFERNMTTAFVLPGERHRPISPGEGQDKHGKLPAGDPRSETGPAFGQYEVADPRTAWSLASWKLAGTAR
jgi:hypothetical protein